jgi:NAD(P)-dependent dehydrogenase (short-subunit alcohol dehydrogenase family)
MDLELRGRTAVITGGTKGIGAGIARVLAGEGVSLALVYRSDPADAEAFAAALTAEYGVPVRAFAADVSRSEAVERLYDEILSAFPAADILVNNAAGGTPEGKAFETLTPAEWDACMAGCLSPVFLMSRRFAAECGRAGHGGHIVNVSAKAAFVSRSKNKVPYATAKGAVAAMTRSLANDLIDRGIFVNAIIPGYVLSGYYSDPASPKCRAKEKDLRIGWATPEDMGNIVAFLCSPRARQIIGALIDCSGGTLY